MYTCLCFQTVAATVTKTFRISGALNTASQITTHPERYARTATNRQVAGAKLPTEDKQVYKQTLCVTWAGVARSRRHKSAILKTSQRGTTATVWSAQGADGPESGDNPDGSQGQNHAIYTIL